GNLWRRERLPAKCRKEDRKRRKILCETLRFELPRAEEAYERKKKSCLLRQLSVPRNEQDIADDHCEDRDREIREYLLRGVRIPFAADRDSKVARELEFLHQMLVKEH